MTENSAAALLADYPPLALLAVGLLLALLFALWLLWLDSRFRRQAPRGQEPRADRPTSTWRLRPRRDGELSAAALTAFFRSLAPHLAQSGPQDGADGVVWELRGGPSGVELRLTVPASLESQLRAQLGTWLPGALLEPQKPAPPLARSRPDAPHPTDDRVQLPLLTTTLPCLPLEGDPSATPLRGMLGLLAASGSALGENQPVEGECGFRVEIAPPPATWRVWSRTALRCLQEDRPLPPWGPSFPLWSLLQGPSVVMQCLTSPTPATTPSRTKNHGGVAAQQALAAKLQGPVYAVRLSVWAGTPGEAPERVQDPTTSPVPGRQTGKDAQLLAQCRTLVAQLLLALGGDTGALETAARPLRLRSGEPSHAPALPFSQRLAASAGGEPILLSPAELGWLLTLGKAETARLETPLSRPAAPSAGFTATLPASLSWEEASLLPSDGMTVLGEALTSTGARPFGLMVAERRLHTYVVGKTGTGKSTLLLTQAAQDLRRGHGLGLIDPHGDLAEALLARIPPQRWEDVLLFDPGDREFPVPFNPLHVPRSELRPLAASAVLGVFKKLYGESWGPRLEHFLRNALLAILESPEPTLLALPRLFGDARFRQRVLSHVTDPLLRSFFREEWEGYDPRWRAEAVAPILNKVGQFLATPLVRNVVGVPVPGFDLRTLMDRGGIFIANLSSGRIGDDQAALLGGLLVGAFQTAAMSRADVPESVRRDFFLSVDEFQHFAGPAFAGILSEARKYRLSLTLSHQYLDQLPAAVSDAVFGNAGTLLAFRVGAGDTARLVKELSPPFDAQDLIHLPNHRFCARLTHLGQVVPPFSARTLPPGTLGLDPSDDEGRKAAEEVRRRSRARWSRPRAEVELAIADFWEGRTL